MGWVDRFALALISSKFHREADVVTTAAGRMWSRIHGTFIPMMLSKTHGTVLGHLSVQLWMTRDVRTPSRHGRGCTDRCSKAVP